MPNAAGALAHAWAQHTSADASSLTNAPAPQDGLNQY